MVTNHGNSNATNVTLTLTPPSGLTNVQYSLDNITYFNYTDPIVLGTLNVQDPTQFLVKVTVSENAYGTLDNLAVTVAATQHDPNTTNNTVNSGTVAITTKDAPVITTTSLPSLQVGKPVDVQLEATSVAPVTWALDGSSTLPDGLTLTTNGRLYGTPETVSAYSFTVEADNGAASSTSQTYAGTIEDNPYTYSVNPTKGKFTGSGDVAFTIDALFDGFIGAKNGSAELQRDVDYTAEEGSTIITLKESYLKTLDNGTRTLTFNFVGRDITAELEVDVQTNGGDTPTPSPTNGTGNAQATTSPTPSPSSSASPTPSATATTTSLPKTGDGSNLWLWIVLMLVASCGIAGVVVRRKRLAKH